MASLYTEPSVQPVAQLLVRAGAHCDICIIRSASVYDKQRSERERGGSKDAPEMTLYVEIKAAHIVSIHGFVHINILSLTIFQVQLCPRSSSSWCGVWVLFSSSYQCVAFRLKEYCTQTDLILSMTHLWTFLAPPLPGLHCLLFFWRMGEEPLLSWLKWLLLRRLSPMSFFFFFFFHRDAQFMWRGLNSWMSQIWRRPCRGCGLKCFSVSRTQRCPPTLTLLPFQPSAIKHVGCFQLHMNRNCNIIIYLFIVEGGTLSIWRRRNPLRGVRMGGRLQNISPRGALRPAHRFTSSDGGEEKGPNEDFPVEDTVSQAALLNG